MTDTERAVRETKDAIRHSLIALSDALKNFDRAIEAVKKEPRTATELSTLESDTLERRVRDWKDQMEAVRRDENEGTLEEIARVAKRLCRCLSPGLAQGLCLACEFEAAIRARISKEET